MRFIFQSSLILNVSELIHLILMLNSRVMKIQRIKVKINYSEKIIAEICQIYCQIIVKTFITKNIFRNRKNKLFRIPLIIL